MPETPQEYTKRILSYTKNQDALKIQQATAKRIERLVKGLTKKQLMNRPAPDKWSIGEILAHLAEAELVGGYRMRLILSASGTRNAQSVGEIVQLPLLFAPDCDTIPQKGESQKCLTNNGCCSLKNSDAARRAW